MNQVAINTNFSDMAKLMGMSVDNQQSEKASTLARLRISHAPIMGEAEVNGKTKKVEVVEGGTYRLEIPDGPTYYASKVVIRPFVQRFMYKRFVKGNDNTPNRYIKTVMADNLNIDLKDNDGGFNCGKPAGFIKDYNALPEKTKQIIKGIKRVRAIFGTVVLNNPVDARGEDIVMDKSIPFIWEIDNRDAFKIMGVPIAKMHGWKHILPQHNIECATEKRDLPNGNSFYLPTADVTNNVLDITDEQHKLFEEFVQWIKNYNEYIFKTWTDKRESELTDEEANTVNEFVDVELESDAK